MRVDVIMPQMGESIQEGTVVRWLKKVGDRVKRDEPILEISTDKVDAEIPSPAAGVLAEITVGEGTTVEIKSVLGSIETEAVATAPAPEPAAPRPAGTETGRTTIPSPGGAARPAPSPVAPPRAAIGSPEERLRTRSSPLVRRIAREHDVDLAVLSGTGIAGRVTKKNILDYLESGGARPGSAAAPPPAIFAPGERVRVEPLSVMRRKISEHMVASKRTSAHVHSFFEVDYTVVDRIRREKKDEFLERYGVKLTYLPFILQATVEALKAWPILNASVDGENLVYKKDINLGVAVALDWGLIVPVIRNAEEKSFLGLCRAVNDMAERARSKKLSVEEVQGGTFTITNHGLYGSLFGTPIINQPQVAILGIGAIEKRPVVVNDAIAIRSMCYLCLSFDHRVIDGAVADPFMARLKEILQEWTIPIR